MTWAVDLRTTASALSRAGAVVVVVAMLVLASSAVARAHEAQAGVRYRITDVSPQVDGVTVQVVRGLAGQLVLSNTSGEPVEVLDDAGTPFLRIGPDAVEADVASPTWAASDRPFGLGGGDPAGPAGDASRWVTLSEDDSWGWYDHRLHAAEVSAPADATGPVTLDTWSVPLRVGGRDVTVAGQTVSGPALGLLTPRLVTDRQPAPGVDVTLLPGASTGIMLTIEPGHEVRVRGEAGEPFLWFTADGGVKVNAASPTWHRTGGGVASSVVVDPGATPVWEPVSEGRRFGWIEPRAVAPEVEGNPPADTVLSTWAVPLEVDGRDATILGELRWVPNPSLASHAAPRGLLVVDLVLGGAGLAVVAALLVVRRRSRHAA